MPANTAYVGAADVTSFNNEFNETAFVVEQAIKRISTAKIVRVTAVTNAGGMAPVGFVDAQPLVHQIDGLGRTTPHAVAYHLAYFRLQGGGNAVILDPQVGDIGLAVCADRDSSAVKATRAAAPPGSRRSFSLSDGIYLGGILNGTPIQTIQFSGGGITITSPTAVTINAPAVRVNP